MRTPKSVLERRRSVRIPETLPFTIGHKDYEIESVTVNISSHGALCVVDRDIPMMTQLEVALSLPAAAGARQRPRTLRMKGVVVRKEKDAANSRFFVAIFFSEVRPEAQKALEDFIHRRLKA